MQAVASLVADDPYLKLSPDQRLDAYRARRSRLFRVASAPESEPPKPVTECSLAAQALPKPPEPKVGDMSAWVERQRRRFKKPWFSIVAEIETGPPRIETIQRVVANHYGVTVRDIVSARRTANVVRPRQVAVYIAKQLTLKSLPEIGRRFGGRDHTTALSSIRKITSLVQTEEGLAATVEYLTLLLGGRRG